MIIGILVMLALAMAFVLFYNYSNKKILTETMRSQDLELEHQEKLLSNQILTQERERKRIAQDLHDDIGSKLNVINLYLHQLNKDTISNGKKEHLVEEMGEIVHSAIDMTRRITHELLPPTLERLGLEEAIAELAEEYSHSDELEVDFELHNDNGRIADSVIELNLFRILQELINNSIKHGAASHISISLWQDAGIIRMQYKDNGRGFNPQDQNKELGLGLSNIMSRVQMIKGTMKIDSQIGKSTEVFIQLTK